MKATLEGQEAEVPEGGKRQAPFLDFSPWDQLPPRPEAEEMAALTEQWPRMRIFDRVAALVLLMLLLPLIVLIALAIKIEDPRAPVFYSQERVGLNRRQTTNGSPRSGRDRRKNPALGQPFMILKFRTMVPEAEAATGPVWATNNDPRITRVGGILRHLRLDELPQLINVVSGHMRLIGPRPERPFFVQRLAESMPDYSQRLSVPPGITGLAQVEKHYDASIKDVRIKLGYDIFYVENKCFMLDVKILAKTIDVVLRGRGAR